VAGDRSQEQHVERLTAEVERLRELEHDLRRERERVLAETAAEIGRLQAALREAAAHAGALDSDLEQRARASADLEQKLAEREAEVSVAAERIRELAAKLEEERQLLRAERARLQQESERLAEWERHTLLDAPAVPLPATFDEGFRRLGEPGAARHSPQEGSW
jgi:chromosome segregation ATPase